MSNWDSISEIEADEVNREICGVFRSAGIVGKRHFQPLALMHRVDNYLDELAAGIPYEPPPPKPMSKAKKERVIAQKIEKAYPKTKRTRVMWWPPVIQRILWRTETPGTMPPSEELKAWRRSVGIEFFADQFA